jgi:uncharacterized protein (TIGR02246 family)
MNRTRIALATLAALDMVFASGIATAARADSPLAAVRLSIDAGNAKFLKALEAGDAKAYASLFAPDGIELPSGGGEITKGRAAIEADEEGGAKAAQIKSGSIHTTNVYLDGRVAYETGLYSFVVVSSGKPARTVYGRYFEIWEEQPSGAWLIKVDCGYADKYKR